MMFRIDKNIPVPLTSGMGRPTIYPFADMAVGDSILVPVNKAGGARVSAYYHGKIHKKKFTAQRVADGYRIWRVK